MLKSQWNFERNNALGLFPSRFVPGSGKIVWWSCSSGKKCHVWKTQVRNRTFRGCGCPFCYGTKPCLIDGCNTIKVKRLDLTREFDLIKNEKGPEHYTPGSNKRVWWLCSSDKKCHSWQTTVVNRALQGSNCPFCCGRQACLVDGCNTIKIHCPNLVKEFDLVKNEGKRPEHYTPGSHKRVWWLCSSGKKCHSWWSRVYHRTQGKGCIFCCGKQVCLVDGCNTLKIKYPDLADQWDMKKNKKGPEHYTPGSHKKVWWSCSANKEHSWEASILNRTQHGNGCPFCRQSKLEKATQEFFDKIQISYIPRHKITVYPYDFYIPSKTLFIELQGEQHFMYNAYYNTKRADKFETQIYRDTIKLVTAYAKGSYLSISFLSLKQIPDILREVLDLDGTFIRQYITRDKYVDLTSAPIIPENPHEKLIYFWYTHHISCVNTKNRSILFKCKCGAIFPEGSYLENHGCEFSR